LHRHLTARLGRADDPRQVAGGAHRLAVELEDDVAGLDAGFLGGALGLSGGLATRALLLASQELVTWSQAMEQGIELLPLLAFPEGLMNGMAVTLMAVYRPQWLATFDERKFLN